MRAPATPPALRPRRLGVDRAALGLRWRRGESVEPDAHRHASARRRRVHVQRRHPRVLVARRVRHPGGERLAARPRGDRRGLGRSPHHLVHGAQGVERHPARRQPLERRRRGARGHRRDARARARGDAQAARGRRGRHLARPDRADEPRPLVRELRRVHGPLRGDRGREEGGDALHRHRARVHVGLALRGAVGEPRRADPLALPGPSHLRRERSGRGGRVHERLLLGAGRPHRRRRLHAAHRQDEPHPAGARGRMAAQPQRAGHGGRVLQRAEGLRQALHLHRDRLPQRRRHQQDAVGLGPLDGVRPRRAGRLLRGDVRGVEPGDVLDEGPVLVGVGREPARPRATPGTTRAASPPRTC